MRCSLAILCLFIALLAPQGLGADEARFTYTLGQHDVDYQPAGAATGVNTEWDDNQRFEVGAYSNLGWVWGFGISLQQAEVSAANNDWSLEYDAWSFRTYVGKTPVQGQSMTWEILGYSGIGLARGDLSRTDGGVAGDDSSFLYEIGAQTNVTLAISQQFSVGAGVGYELIETSLDIGGGSDVTQKGLYYQGFLGYRF